LANEEGKVDDMRQRLLVVLISMLALVVGIPAAAAAEDTTPQLPNSIAAIGDSMTQATDVCCWYGDHPANSWSTGSASWDAIRSHYERIRARNPAVVGHNYNGSVSGARMADAPGQASRAVAQGAGYVTILMGANDVCASSLESMTSVEVFHSQVQQTLATLDSGLPGPARVFVSSIPDVYQLWQLYHTNAVAQFVWDVADICQSLLSPNRTEEQRQQVRQRSIDYNVVLQQECQKYSRCRFDDNAVFSYPFRASDVSRLDYFHPSLAGQAQLASITWSKSWWA
jgi:lysophospholipase L1-like esterase